MDAQTISAFAAAGAALVAGTGALIQFFTGSKQAQAALVAANAAMKNAEAAMKSVESAGRHRVATFRQAWIITNIETLSEFIAIATVHEESRSAEDRKNLATLSTKLGLLLNPNEPPVRALIAAMDHVLKRSADDETRAKNVGAMVELAHNILKDEWVRIKTELQ